MIRPPPLTTLFPYTTLFRSSTAIAQSAIPNHSGQVAAFGSADLVEAVEGSPAGVAGVGSASGVGFTVTFTIAPWQLLDANTRLDRKSTRLNSSHSSISYAVF